MTVTDPLDSNSTSPKLQSMSLSASLPDNGNSSECPESHVTPGPQVSKIKYALHGGLLKTELEHRQMLDHCLEMGLHTEKFNNNLCFQSQANAGKIFQEDDANWAVHNYAQALGTYS